MEPIRRSDSEDLFEAVVSQDSVMRWLATGRAGSRSAAEAMCDDHVAHWARHGYGDFAVRDATTHAFLGRVGLRNRRQFGVDLGFACTHAPRAVRAWIWRFVASPSPLFSRSSCLTTPPRSPYCAVSAPRRTEPSSPAALTACASGSTPPARLPRSTQSTTAVPTSTR